MTRTLQVTHVTHVTQETIGRFKRMMTPSSIIDPTNSMNLMINHKSIIYI